MGSQSHAKCRKHTYNILNKMSLGFAPYLLKSIAQVALENNPEMVLDPAGAFNLLNSQKAASVVSESPAANGHRRQVNVKYQQRATPSQVADTISCDNVIVPIYNETTVSVDIKKQLGIYIDDETIARYMDEASRTVAVGLPQTQFMAEFLFSVMTSTNALVQALDIEVLTKLATNVGVNVVSGNNSATAINIPLNTTVNPLNNSINKILTDFNKNGLKGTPQILGAGLFWDFVTQQPFKTSDFNGLNTAAQASKFQFYADLNAETVLGTNQVLVVAPNSIQRVDYITNQGFRAGLKGASYFFTIDLPMQIGSEIVPITFDAHLKYIDCPTELVEAYTGEPVTAERGYALYISKQMGVFQIPSDAYQTTDRLYGVNGTLLYTISNECADCPA
jgi:hypothetical protein